MSNVVFLKTQAGNLVNSKMVKMINSRGVATVMGPTGAQELHQLVANWQLAANQVIIS